jgi:hypothetical protein
LDAAENTERKIFVAAHQLNSDDEREAYLKDACADRPELLQRVRHLLTASAIEDGFFDTPEPRAAPGRWRPT